LCSNDQRVELVAEGAESAVFPLTRTAEQDR